MRSIRTQRMIDSAPYYYQFSRVYEAIQAAQADEYDSIDAKIADLQQQLYIPTATWGLKYWEEILGIPVLPDVWRRYEQSESNFKFNGTWWTLTNADASGGDANYSTVKGSEAVITFKGSAVRLLARTNVNRGYAKVTVDKCKPGLVDMYSTWLIPQNVVFETTGLLYKEHVLKVEVTGLNNPNSSDYEVYVDAIEVLETAESYDIRRSRVLSYWRGFGSFSAKLIKNVAQAYTNGEVEVTTYTKNKLQEPITLLTDTTCISAKRVVMTLDTDNRYINTNSIKLVTNAEVQTDDYLELLGTLNLTKYNYAYHIKPNSTYTFSFYGKVVTGSIAARVVELDKDGNVLIDYRTDASNIADWHRLSVTRTASPACAGLLLRVRVLHPITTAYVDGFQLEEGPLTTFEEKRDYTVGITFSGSLGSPPNIGDLQALVDNIVHAHLNVRYKYKYLKINQVHNVMTLNQMQARKLTDFAPFTPVN